MALGYRLPLAILCQEMRDACEGSSESLGSRRSLCSECLEERRRCSNAQFPSFIYRLGLHAGDSFEHFVPSPKRGFSLTLFVCLFVCRVWFRRLERGFATFRMR